MSKSTKWMKKGFAWLLCLIMMTGMLSSAASAGGPPMAPPAPPQQAQQPELAVNYYGMFTDMAWIVEGETESIPSLSFSAEFKQSSKPNPDKGNFTFEWFFVGEHGDEKVFDKSDKENNVKISWDNDSKYYSAKSKAYNKSIKDLYNVKGAGKYYCKVTFKFGGTSYTAETLSVTLTKKAKLVFLKGDNGIDKDVYVEIGRTISEDQKPTAPVVEGSKLVGWKNTGTEAMLDFTTPVVNGGIYEAVYEKLPTFTVTFNYNHGKMGTFAGELNDDNSNTVKRPEDPEKCESGNHVFVDWYEDAQKTKLFPFETPITEDVEEVIIYAGWGYVVTFDVNLEGVTKIDSKKVLQDTPVTLPKENPTDPEGKYEFVCWKNGNKEYKGEKITKTTTLVAEWKKITQTISLQADESYVYNGKSQGVKVAGAEITADKYTITYETKDAWGRWVPAWEVKNAGDYRATLSIKKGVTGYQIAEGGNQVTFSIQPKLITGITWTDTELEYNGKDQKPVATANDLVGNDECDLTVTGAKKHAGVDYQASVTTVGNPNYKIDEKTKNVTTTFTIKKRPVTITWTNTTKTYSGGNMTPDVGLNLLGARVDGVVYELQGAATDVGKHEVKVVLLGDAADNYELPEDATTTFTISPKTITVKWSNNVSLEYTGEEQAPKVDVVGFIDSDLKNNLVSYAINGKESEIGNDYEASVVLTGEKAGNYSLPDDTSVKYSIVKIGNSMRLTGVERTKQYGESFKIGYYANYNTGKITYTSSDESVATIAEDGTITCVKPGKTTIKAVLIASDHHEGAEASFDLEVTKRKITISWGNNSLTYNGEVQAPEATANNVLESDKEKVKISVYGGQKDVGYNYWAWVVLAENDYYELARANNGKQFNIVQANSSITVDENTITKTYGAEPFGISYKSTGGTVEISLPWNNGVAHYDPWTKKIVIDHAGTVDITLNNKGDRNHSESSVTISLTVEPKTVSITWDKEDPISYEYDTHHHQPAATVNGLVTVNGKTVPCSAEVIVTGDKVSHGQARAVGKYKITVTGLTNKDYVLDENGSYSKEFEIVEVVEDTKLEVREGATTVYYLGVDEDKITLNLENIVIVEKLRSTNKNRETNVEARMIDASFDGSLLGKQTVIVNYNNLKLTFDIQIIKMIEPMWDDTQLVYNGDLRVPEFDVNGVESWKEIITLTHDNSVNASDAASTYSVTATINKDQEGKYVFVDNQYVSTCEYTIDPKPVTLTWNFEGAKTEYVDEIIPVYIFFVGHDKIAPTAQLKDTEEDILVLTTKDEEGNPVKDASAAGHYSIEASLSSTNYAFANDSETSVGYSVEVPVVTKIEVLKGYKADYYVGDAFDNENLKIKATLSDDSTQELAAKDNEKITVTGFDSATEGTKALTVKYEGQTAGFTVEVSKKQSTIDLKNGGDNVKATYGDAPIDLVFDAVNGEVIISSSNENVAKVENGKLVIVGAGEAEITLEIKDTDAVVGIKKSFTFEVERKVVGLEWSKENTFTEDGAKHSLTAKATGLVGTDSCDVIVEGGSAEVGTHTVTATGLSNKNYKLPEKASTTFVINAKEEPKQGGSTVEEPKKEEPAKEEPKKEEPAKEEPKKIKAEIKISEQFKSTYFVGEEFDPSGLTLEIENADGTKTTIPVTKDMVTGFNSQKVGDGEAVITYEDYTKKIPVTIVEKGEYTFSITTEANGDMHFVVIRKPGNDIAYSLYLGTYVDGKLVPADGIKTWSGSVHGLLFADYLKTLPAGDHKIEVVFKDGKAVATLTIPATTPASDASPVTGDTSSLTMWIILLAAAAAVLVAIRVYAAKRSNAE